ncbi:MAG: hypothetical protein GXP55_15755 [Deltaproteobacteria bacterium]|nr:hypothetical protein [Deltaproteobacteria bacterium]
MKEAKKQGVVHWSRKELLGLLKGPGKGKASWPSVYEVMQARKRVEQHSEHLLDFEQLDVEDVVCVCSTVWSKR